MTRPTRTYAEWIVFLSTTSRGGGTFAWAVLEDWGKEKDEAPACALLSALRMTIEAATVYDTDELTPGQLEIRAAAKATGITPRKYVLNQARAAIALANGHITPDEFSTISPALTLQAQLNAANARADELNAALEGALEAMGHTDPPGYTLKIDGETLGVNLPTFASAIRWQAVMERQFAKYGQAIEVEVVRV